MPPVKAKPGASANDPADAPQFNQGDASPSGLVPLQAPIGATMCGIDDQQYPVVDGVVNVQERHVGPLRSIGFSFVTE